MSGKALSHTLVHMKFISRVAEQLLEITNDVKYTCRFAICLISGRKLTMAVFLF